MNAAGRVFLLAGCLLAASGCRAQDAPATHESSITGDAGARDASDADGDAATDGDASVPVDDGPFDPAVGEEIGALFGRIVHARHPPGTTNVKRAVFLKPHGCAKAKVAIAADLPPRLRVGVFGAPTTHDAWVRISSDTVPSTSDRANNTIGFAVKLLGVPGRKILPGEESFQTHDFLLQNHDVFFVDTASEFLDFTRSIFDRKTDQWLADHPRTKTILDDMAKEVPNVLGTRYWSTTPYRFGNRDFAKYAVRPCAPLPEEPPPANEDNYLRKRLERDVAERGACFELQVQLRGEGMPLDQATVPWSEVASPLQTVAKISIPAQDIVANDAVCENLSFTAWHALPEHQPVGSVNKARGIVYKQLADLRRTRNGVAISEPER